MPVGFYMAERPLEIFAEEFDGEQRVKRIDSTGIGRFIYSLNKVEENGG